jgi:hypothetical protein
VDNTDREIAQILNPQPVFLAVLLQVAEPEESQKLTTRLRLETAHTTPAVAVVLADTVATEAMAQDRSPVTAHTLQQLAAQAAVAVAVLVWPPAPPLQTTVEVVGAVLEF